MGVAKETVTRNFADNSCVRPVKISISDMIRRIGQCEATSKQADKLIKQN